MLLLSSVRTGFSQKRTKTKANFPFTKNYIPRASSGQNYGTEIHWKWHKAWVDGESSHNKSHKPEEKKKTTDFLFYKHLQPYYYQNMIQVSPP